MRLISDLSEIGQERWDRLAFPTPDSSPFLRYAFLSALHETGCASPRSGWQPCFLTLWSGKELLGACPLYRKAHSYGEYVFDWAWADAYRRHGLPYYPKLLVAVPFTPVTGPRLMAQDDATRAVLAHALLALVKAESLSSLHVLYPPPGEARALAQAGMMLREGVQFHWTNEGYQDFAQFIETLERKKRKNIRAERRKVAEAGVSLRRVLGRDATAADWRFFVRCYDNTYRAHHSSPYLNLAFFQRIGREMPENLVLVIAERERRPIASSLVLVTPSALYGRYWGEVEHVPCLHFECAYYQPLEYCIEQKIQTFEGGAQGEHKMARGFLPVITHSAHWLAHPAFADAIEEFLARESSGIQNYVDELRDHNPFKSFVSGGEAP
jgi:predicted N-acyltransferase